MDDSSGMEFTNKMSDLFPSIEEKVKEPLINIFAELLISFEDEINKSKHLKYLNDIPEDTDKSEYLSKIPDGVHAFELWLKDGLFDISKSILLRLEEILPSSIGHMYFSLFLDNQNFDEYFNKVNLPPELQSEFIVAYSDLFAQVEYRPFIQSIGCACIGFHNSATTIMTVFIQNIMLGNIDTYKLINEAKTLETVRNKARLDSLRSNDIKHAKIRRITQYAIQLYLSGSYPSVKNCSENIAPKVLEYSKTAEVVNLPGKNKTFNPITLPRTIERWIGNYNKKSKANL